MPLKRKQPKALPIIGPKTVVDFVDYGINGVPAKVDTGANTSSVWASQIQEDDGILSFVLFSPESSYYTGDVIMIKDYKVRRVKNSFGDTQFRYQVYMRIRLEDKLIKANVTLANRENNRFPILIGARTLKGKFLVDVNRRSNFEGTKKRMLLLVTQGGDQLRAGFDDIAEQLGDGLEIDIIRYDQIRIEFVDDSVAICAGDQKLNDYQLIYFFVRVKNEEIAAIIAKQANKLGINYFDPAASRLYPNGKLYQLYTLRAHGIRIPDTVFVFGDKWPKEFEYLKKRFGLPFIFKDNAGRKGQHNYLVKTEAQFRRIAREAVKEERLMIAQKFIPSDGYYRLLALGGNVDFVSYRRIDLSVSHFYKKKNGLPAEIVRPETMPLDVLETASRAAELMEINVAGVDMLQDKQTKEWYCLEVNSSPQLINGSFVDEKLAAMSEYIKKELE